MPKTTSLSVTREAVLLMLYAYAAGGSTQGIEWPENLEAERIDLDRAQAQYNNILQHFDDLDASLAAHTKGWRLGRVARVDLSILRLCLYEMRYENLPAAIAINEAVELARRYGGEQSPVFINGVMSAFVPEQQPQD